MVRKTFEKLVNNKLTDHLKKIGLSSSFQYGSRSSCLTADLRRVVSYRIAINKSSFSPTVALINSRLLTGFDKLVFFIKLHLIEFHVEYLRAFHLFSVTDGFKWFWMGSPFRNIQIMLVFHYTFMTCLNILTVILPSMFIILLSILSVIRHLTSCNK